MAVTIKLADEVVWGTSAAGTLASGKIISCSKKDTTKQHEEPNENGELHSLVLYDQRAEVSLEVLAGKTAVPPAIGSSLSVVGSTTLIVTEVETAWKRGDTKKFNISAFVPV